MKDDRMGEGYCFGDEVTRDCKSVIQDSLKGSRVCITWMDPAGFINVDLNEVNLAECKSEGIIVIIDDQKVVIRSAVYTGTETGDYTAIPIGCIVKVNAL